MSIRVKECLGEMSRGLINTCPARMWIYKWQTDYEEGKLNKEQPWPHPPSLIHRMQIDSVIQLYSDLQQHVSQGEYLFVRILPSTSSQSAQLTMRVNVYGLYVNFIIRLYIYKAVRQKTSNTELHINKCAVNNTVERSMYSVKD